MANINEQNVLKGIRLLSDPKQQQKLDFLKSKISSEEFEEVLKRTKAPPLTSPSEPITKPRSNIKLRLILRILLQSGIAAGLCYGVYKGASYISAILAKKQEVLQARRESQQNPVNTGAIIEEQKGGDKQMLLKLKSSKPEEKVKEKAPDEPKELKQFIDAYKNDQERKEGALHLLFRFNMVLSNLQKDNKKAISINITNQDFKNSVLINLLADEMLKYIGFEKEGAFYVYNSDNTEKLEAAIKYFEKYT